MQQVAGELSRPVASPQTLRLRIAEVTLVVTSDHPPFLEELEGRYGDCVAEPAGGVTLQCTARRAGEFLSLDFSGCTPPEPFECALTPFRMLRHLPGRVIAGSPQPGWRALVGDSDDDFVMAGDATRLMVRVEDSTRDLAVDCLIAVALRAQPDILFLHAASFAIAGRGALLLGPGKSGKSTTVLALAARGHAFLGDDLAAVRDSRAEILPFPKSAGVREGQPAREIEARARPFRAIPGTGLDGIPRKYVRVGDMFPGARSAICRLDSVFMIEGFAREARITPYQPSLRDVARLKVAVSENVPGWGESPGADLVKFLRVTDLLSRARCYLLELGALDASAMLIEQAMETT